MCIRTVYVHIYNIYAVAFVLYTAHTPASMPSPREAGLHRYFRGIPLEGIGVGGRATWKRRAVPFSSPKGTFSPSG